MKKLLVLLISVVSLSALFFGGCSTEYDDMTEEPADMDSFSSGSNIGFEMLQYPSSNGNFEYNVYETYVEITWYTGLSTDVIIPDEIDGLPVKVIGERAFSGEKNETIIRGRSEYFSITSVTLPQNLVEIGEYAFFHHALKELIIPDSVEKIGECAFEGNCLLSSIVFGNSLREIGEWAFRNCNLKGQIVLPESLITIGERAFDVYTDSFFNYNDVWYYSEASTEGQAKLNGETTTYDGKDVTKIEVFEIGDATIIIPASVVSIGEDAFYWRYTLNCPKGSNAVQYIVDSGHENYCIY